MNKHSEWLRAYADAPYPMTGSFDANSERTRAAADYIDTLERERDEALQNLADEERAHKVTAFQRDEALERVSLLRSNRDYWKQKASDFRKAIEDAPHQMGCSSLPTHLYGSIELCDCWKREALGDE